ncbi:MAG: glycosyltransferase family 39 protein [Candidatus Daviesbacteria bacterium]|nr:glycosyltransferase family 39 protein [Candidatus Daviesbacteria bacterium]
MISLMSKSVKDCIFLTFLTLLVTALVWLPHLLALPGFWGLSFKEGLSTIYKNFDGLEYVVIAKTFYNPLAISALPQSLPANYFAAHFPGYALLIAIFAPILGYLKSMLFVSMASTVLAGLVFYFLVKDFKLSNHPLFLSFIFLILPARWLIVHSVGSSEPTFILFILSAVYFFMRFEQSGKPINIFLAGMLGLFAQITRPPGILLFIALFLYLLYKFFFHNKLTGFKNVLFNSLKYTPLTLIPLGLLGIFYLYSQTYGDFWAYFKSGDNIHLTLPPFQVFNKEQFWVGDIWLEDIIYIFILGFLGGVMLIKQKLYPLAFLVLTYLAASSLIAHRDISRYVLPVSPFILIAFEKVLTSKEFRIILPIILLAIYLYAQNFLIANVAPIPRLELFN